MIILVITSLLFAAMLSAGGIVAAHGTNFVLHGAYVPGYQKEMPYYFSATNCLVEGEVGASSGGYLTSASLKVNKTIVKQMVNVPGLYPLSTRLQAIFDSTHFNNGETATISIDALDSQGNTYHAEGQAPIKNGIVISTHPSMPDGTWESAETTVPYPKFSQAINHENWGPLDLFAAMPGKSVVYMATHGSPSTIACALNYIDTFGDHSPTQLKPAGADEYYAGHPGWLSLAGVLPHRAPQMGSGFPPFNDTQIPPISIAVILACDAGVSNAFASGFLFPGQHSYGAPSEDQALTGFTCPIYVHETDAITALYLGPLSSGKTMLKSRKEFIDSGLCHECPTLDPLTIEDMPIWGDKHTRLTAVYTGNDNDTTHWYRGL
ncbi:hypothetical protein BH11ARM1_BH11ARM1_09690 [soil metagenome]